MQYPYERHWKVLLPRTYWVLGILPKASRSMKAHFRARIAQLKYLAPTDRS